MCEALQCGCIKLMIIGINWIGVLNYHYVYSMNEVAISHVAEVYRCNVNIDHMQLQLHRVLHSMQENLTTTPLNRTTIPLCMFLQHHPTGTRLYDVQHSYLIYS